MPESMMDAGTVPWDAEKTKKDNFSNVFSYHIYLKNKAKTKSLSFGLQRCIEQINVCKVYGWLRRAAMQKIAKLLPWQHLHVRK